MITAIEWSLGVWHGHIFNSWLDGKLLQVWLTTLISPFFSNLILASRCMTVLCDVIAVFSCYQIGKRLQNKFVGVFSACLYILSPFALFYDRMALADGMLSAFAALTLLCSIALMQEPSRKWSTWLGWSMALAVFAKVIGVLVFFIPILAVMFLKKHGEIRSYLKRRRF